MRIESKLHAQIRRVETRLHTHIHEELNPSYIHTHVELNHRYTLMYRFLIISLFKRRFSYLLPHSILVPH